MTDSSDAAVDTALAAQAAERLRAAYETRTPCAPIRDLMGESDIAAGYAVQHVNIRARLEDEGRHIVGRKIGLTSKAVQDQLGVHQPDFGYLFDDMGYAESETVPMSRLLQPKAEAEIAFVLAEDLAEGPLDVEQVRGAVAHAVAALEIVDSRIADWDIRFTDTVADNASSGLYVLGDTAVSLDDVEPKDVTMTMTLDGEVVSQGTGAACLGDPLNALAWLAQTCRDFGEPLRAGHVVLSGALGPMVAVPAGSTFTAEITGLGSVTARFSGKDDE